MYAIGKLLKYCQFCCLHQITLRIACLFVAGIPALGFVIPSTAAPLEISQSDLQSIFTVTNLSDTDDGKCDSDCSLREALVTAPTNSTINFAQGLKGEIKLKSTLNIDKNVTINGPAKNSITISGDHSVRVFNVNQSCFFKISNLTVANGFVEGEAGSDGKQCEDGEKGAAADGAGLYNDKGNVTVTNVAFINNRLEGGRGGNGGLFLYEECKGGRGGEGGDGRGGALFSTGSIILINSTFSDNKSEGGNGGKGGSGGGDGGYGGLSAGGAICATGSVIMVNCTFSHNKATAGSGSAGGSIDQAKISSFGAYEGFPGGYGNSIGGAIYSSYDMQINNSTLTGNNVWAGSKDHARPGIGSGGAIYNAGKLTIRNSIIDDSSSGGNCSGPVQINSEGYNIDSDGTCGLTAIGDLSQIDPKLKSLKNNGGATMTHALKSDSPAIDGGNPKGCIDHNGEIITTDQRGYNRPLGEQCDIGAFEYSK
jgi:CSLREA domain-containing protein